MKRWAQSTKESGWTTSPLFGHLLATAAIFSTICTLTWLGSVLFNFLNSISHFPHAMVVLVEDFEIGCFLIDCTGSGLFLLYGMIRVLYKTLESH